MKENTSHVFFVPSNLCILICKAIILTEGLSAENVFFVCDRGVKLPEGFNGIELQQSWCGSFFTPSRRFIKKRRHLRWLDDLIKAATCQRKFVLYVNDMTRDYIPLVSTHPYNEGVCIYEEGFASYSRKLHLGPKESRICSVEYLKGRILATLCYGVRYFRPKHFYHDWYLNAYCTSNLSFRNFPRKRLVSLNLAFSQDSNEFASEIPWGSSVIALDPLASPSSDMTVKDEINILYFVLELMVKKTSMIYLKRHPGCCLDTKAWDDLIKTMRDKFKGCELFILPSDVYLENLFYQRRDIKLVTRMSSSAIYASQFGVRVFTYLNVYNRFTGGAIGESEQIFMEMTRCRDIEKF